MQPVEIVAGDSPVILGQPHGGTWLPADVADRLNPTGRAPGRRAPGRGPMPARARPHGLPNPTAVRHESRSSPMAHPIVLPLTECKIAQPTSALWDLPWTTHRFLP